MGRGRDGRRPSRLLYFKHHGCLLQVMYCTWSQVALLCQVHPSRLLDTWSSSASLFHQPDLS